MNTQTKKFTVSDVGCFFDDARGIYLGKAIQNLALSFGWPEDKAILDTNHAHYNEATDEAIEWLNENCIEENEHNLSFGFDDGGFFLNFPNPEMSDCEFEIEATQDDCQVRGNALASGDAAADKKCEDEIIKRLDQGDIWAWASVKVTCKWNGHEGRDYLGGCSYKDEADFKAEGGYYEDMKKQAYGDMLEGLR